MRVLLLLLLALPLACLALLTLVAFLGRDDSRSHHSSDCNNPVGSRFEAFFGTTVTFAILQRTGTANRSVNLMSLPLAKA
jgi:hypothetical protein